jgi:hypothetical protein
VDVFTKYIVLCPLRDKTAVTVGRAIFEHVFMVFGAGEILTDNGLEFRNELLDELCRLLGVARAFTTAYQARTNAVCERNHATINSMLAKYVADNQKDWTDHLSQVAFCYNASSNEATKASPFFLMHGFQPRWDVDLRLDSQQRPAYSENDYANLLVDRLHTAHENAREHMHVAAGRNKDWYDRKVHTQRFTEGEEVYVLNLRLYEGRCPKWVRRYSDTATIVQKINDVTYKVKGPWRKALRIVHVDKLKRRPVRELGDA